MCLGRGTLWSCQWQLCRYGVGHAVSGFCFWFLVSGCLGYRGLVFVSLVVKTGTTPVTGWGLLNTNLGVIHKCVEYTCRLEALKARSPDLYRPPHLSGLGRNKIRISLRPSRWCRGLPTLSPRRPIGEFAGGCGLSRHLRFPSPGACLLTQRLLTVAITHGVGFRFPARALGFFPC